MTLLAQEIEQIRGRPTTDSLALQYYLQGRFLLGRRDRESLEAARDLFAQAVARDNAYAQAHAGLADAYSLLAFVDRERGAEAWAPAEHAAREAVRLDDENAEARTSLALTLAYGHWDWDSALAEYDRALQLDPQYPLALYLSAEMFLLSGQLDSAEARTARAIDLDPLDAVAWVLHGWALLSKGDMAAAHHLWRTAYNLQPGFTVTLFDLLTTYGRMGDTDSVRITSRAIWDILAPGGVVAEAVDTAAGLLYTGQATPEQAALFVHTLEEYGFKNVAAANAFVSSGHLDSAFARLDTAITWKNEWLPILFSFFERQTPLGSDPRWASVRERVGVPGR